LSMIFAQTIKQKKNFFCEPSI